MNFCSQCGATVVLRVPADDNRLRFVCDSCGEIHYQNPRIITGCIPILGQQTLLCKRAIEPRLGCWTLPAGFMENGETTPEGAVREVREEANAIVQVERLFSFINIPRINQVYVMFVASMLSEKHGAGTESSETCLYTEEQTPWNKLAFTAVEITLRQFFDDRRKGITASHLFTIDRHPSEPSKVVVYPSVPFAMR